MTQLLRLWKLNVPALTRNYGRSRGTYYDTLGIPPSATQKEIKAAFFKLSKEVHPDAAGKGSHADFIKINEAYSVLGKESTRYKYDMSLRRPYAPTSPAGVYRSTYNTYEDLRKAYGFPDPRQTYTGERSKSNSFFAKIHPVLLCFIVMFIGVAFQLILIVKSPVFNTKELLKKSAEIEKESKRRIAIAKSRTPEEEQEFLNSILRQVEERDRREKERLAMVR